MSRIKKPISTMTTIAQRISPFGLMNLRIPAFGHLSKIPWISGLTNLEVWVSYSTVLPLCVLYEMLG